MLQDFSDTFLLKTCLQAVSKFLMCRAEGDAGPGSELSQGSILLDSEVL